MHQHPNVIVVGPKGYAEVRDELAEQRSNSALSFHTRWWDGVLFFHRDGNAYEVEQALPEKRLGALSSFLARTIYNPTVTVRYRYRSSGPYSVDELRAAVQGAIGEDDDVLTQFRERAELMALLTQSQSFDDIASVLLLSQRDESAG